MNLKPFIASTAAAAVLAGGALASATVDLLSPAEDDALGLVPQQAIVYGNFFLDPSVDQQIQLKELLTKFPQASTPDDATARIIELLDEGLSAIGMSFTADIEPWLGHQIAFFGTLPGMMGVPGGAALIATEDPDATRAAIDKVAAAEPSQFIPATYGGIDYLSSPDGQGALGVIDDFMVIGTDSGFRQVADTRDSANLGDSASFESAFSGLNEDRLATFFFNPQPLLGAIPGGIPGMGGLGIGTGPTGTVVYARGDALVIESSTTVPPGAQGAALSDLSGSTDLMERLPANAWGAFATPALGESISAGMQSFALAAGMDMGLVAEEFKGYTGLDLFEALGWLGDTALFIQGNDVDSLAGGAVIRSTDPEASSAALDPIARALERDGAPVRPLGLGSFEGFRIADETIPDAFYAIAADERLLAIYGQAAALAALGSDPTLGSTEIFRAAQTALGSDFSPVAFADIQAGLKVLEAAGGFEAAPYGSSIKPFLDPLSFFVAGSRIEGDRALARLVIGVR